MPEIRNHREYQMAEIAEWLYGKDYTNDQMRWIYVRMKKNIPLRILFECKSKCIDWGREKGVKPQKAFKTIFLSTIKEYE